LRHDACQRPRCADLPFHQPEAAMTQNLKPGDKVTWRTSRGETKGTVEQKVTSSTKVKGHTATATEADPEYKVRSDKTGAEAVHKPDSLSKTR
jgi:hypothetical protein